MVLVYASPTDLAAWTGTAAPSNAINLLRTASLAVREATELCYYPVDVNNLPSDATQKQAFNDATCCQAAALIALSVDPLAGGVIQEGVESQSRMGTAGFTFADAQYAADAKQQALNGLVTDAQRILRDAGIAPTVPWIVG